MEQAQETRGIDSKREGKNFEEPKYDAVGLFLDRFGKALDIEHVISGKIDLSHLSPAQKAESMWAILKSIKAGEKLAKLQKQELDQKEKDKLRLTVGILKKLHDDSLAKEKFVEARQRLVQELKKVNGDVGKYRILRREAALDQKTLDEQARRIFSQRGGKISEVDLLLFEASKNQAKDRQNELKAMIEKKSDLGALAQFESLKNQSEQFRKENFMWAPSRLELLEEIEEAALSGKPVLISGESGTGKTRLVEQAALKLTGEINNETPGKDVRFQDLIAKPKISLEGATYYEYKEIGEAATGRSSTLDEKLQHKGRIVADDEFNLLPEAEQTERLARIAAWTPGKKVRMPVTNQEVEIADNFLYCAMVNLASERYSRKKIPPEVLRKFSKVDAGYLRQTEDEPEIYEAMLAALMDENGRIRTAKKDLSPYYEDREEARKIKRDGQEINQTLRIRELRMQKEEGGKTLMAGGFLWRLSNALGELNKSFSRKETVLKSKGEGQYLKDMVIDIGTILGWLKEYSTIGRAKSLEGFFCEKIQKQFLTREAYTSEDRQLVKEFLQYYGIDADKKPEEVGMAEFEMMTPLEIGLLSPRVKYEKVIEEDPVISESFYITPEGKRVEYRIEKYQEGDREFVPGQVFVRTDEKGKKYAEQFLGVSKENGDPVIAPYKKKPMEFSEGKDLNNLNAAKAVWKNPETKQEQELEIDFEKSLSEQKVFYKNKLNLEINEKEVRSIWKKNYAEIKAEMEKYGYDSIIIIPNDLPGGEVLNKNLVENMVENVGGNKKKVEATWQGKNFQDAGSFDGVKNSYSPKYRIILAHSVQNLEDHPILKNTRDKNIMDITGLDEKEVNRRIAVGERLPVDFWIEVGGQKIEIQAEGQSLEEYIIQQAMFFEKTGQHIDSGSSSYARLLKSYSGSRVVDARWDPDSRQLDVAAIDPGYAGDILGLRLSRSFSN